ncbi:hypothetical protein Pcinc_038736 [Petrolisthes cinctipes]|uniref:Uncharacterized protein n=1 Tax=Petrolisthes cinctipes TaxID=88211 RepID=A0AAE1ELA0_PETCI|nr:hypothetical protein Pcinc_038736 [Petrolisthes cinctipes]
MSLSSGNTNQKARKQAPGKGRLGTCRTITLRLASLPQKISPFLSSPHSFLAPLPARLVPLLTSPHLPYFRLHILFLHLFFLDLLPPHLSSPPITLFLLDLSPSSHHLPFSYILPDLFPLDLSSSSPHLTSPFLTFFPTSSSSTCPPPHFSSPFLTFIPTSSSSTCPPPHLISPPLPLLSSPPLPSQFALTLPV